MDIFKWLDDTSFVKEYIINDFRESENAFYFNLQVEFIDNSELFIREYIDDAHRKYSFHWQNKDGELLIRWDNAPHFKEISTYPHHKHIGNVNVVESFDISLEEVISYLKTKIK